MITNKLNNTITLLTFLSALGCSGSTLAESAAQSAPNDFCTEFKIDQSNDEFLTAEEQIAQMEQAFIDSIDREEACIVKTPGNGGGGQNGHGEGLGEGDYEGEGEEQSQQQEDEQLTDTREEKTLSGGSIPKDIPPAENDNVLEAEIRKMAENEKDPVKRKKLWNEYRRYKGIKIK